MQGQNPAQAQAMKGRLIVIDGGNGAGKGTCISAVVERLQDSGHEVVTTREPGGTPIGERIRDILLDANASEMCDITELMLFAAARAQHVAQKILPALKTGKVVVCDRFDSATVSFQHYGRGLSLSLIEQLNAIATGGLKPDITIILDLDPGVGLERVSARGSEHDRMELENLAFLQRARTGYLEQARQNPQAFAVIDASRPREQVFAEVFGIVERTLARAL